MNENMPHSYKFNVSISSHDGSHAFAQARGHEITLNVKKGSGEGGFTAAETLLAALGACLLTNINAIGAKMHLQIDEARVEFDAERIEDPASITKLSYRLIVKSDAPYEKLVELHDLARKWGTVTNTMINGLTPEGELVIAS